MSTEQSAGETQTAHSQVDIAEQATNPAPKPREKTQSVWPRESLSLKEVVLHVNSRKKPQLRLLSSSQTTMRNNSPHHLILPLQKKVAAPSPSPNGLWLAALSLDLPGFITNVKSSRSGPKPFLGEKKKCPSQRVLSQTLPPPHGQKF